MNGYRVYEKVEQAGTSCYIMENILTLEWKKLQILLLPASLLPSHY